MSVRIQSDTIASTDSSRHAEQARASGARTGGAVDRLNFSGFDNVNLSTETSSLTATLASNDIARAGRVEVLRASFLAGRYQVSSSALTGALIASATQLSVGREE